MMPIRELKLPDDFELLATEMPHYFQYPENEAWSVRQDEKESIQDLMGNLRRLWPLLGTIRFFSPAVRDVMRGFVWEEEGNTAGMLTYQRRGTSNTWYINNVAVAPEYRRRGIARKLLSAGIEDMGARDCQQVNLDVIAGNIPAYTLYEKLGFQQFTGNIDLNYPEEAPLAHGSLPEGYALEPNPVFEWRPRYELAKRLEPEEVQAFEPVTESLYRQPVIARLLIPIVNSAQGFKDRRFLITSQKDGQVIGHAAYQVRTRSGGVNRLHMAIDPAHETAASPTVRYLTHTMQSLSPGRRIEFSVPLWQEAVIKAAREAGFHERMLQHRMGLKM
jgi:ribosomal protein S18 acetylase RimI-like enzyme